MSRFTLISVENADICDEVYYGGEWAKVLDRLENGFILRNPGPEDEPAYRVFAADCEAARKLNMRAVQDHGVPHGEVFQDHQAFTVDNMGNVDTADYPDFCDAYVDQASWDETGTDLTDREIEIVNESFRDLVNESAHEFWR